MFLDLWQGVETFWYYLLNFLFYKFLFCYLIDCIYIYSYDIFLLHKFILIQLDRIFPGNIQEIVWRRLIRLYIWLIHLVEGYLDHQFLLHQSMMKINLFILAGLDSSKLIHFVLKIKLCWMLSMEIMYLMSTLFVDHNLLELFLSLILICYFFYCFCLI
jgi:hypothetical protein